MLTVGQVDILGAGPAGLLAGWHAARQGHHVTIFEAAAEPGGMAGSFEVAGLRVDHGSHRLHPTIHPSLLAELQSLLGADLQERPRSGRIRLADRWIGFPLRTTELRRLPPALAVRAGRDALTAPFRRPRADTYYEESTRVERAWLAPYADSDGGGVVVGGRF